MSFHISSNSIKVFPLSKNRTADRSARLFYENNVANIIRQLIDVEGFLISPADSFGVMLGQAVNNVDNTVTYPVNLTKSDLVFNLYGYYFCIVNGSALFEVTMDSSNTSPVRYKVVAALQIDNISNEIAGFDISGKYEGLHIFTLKDNDVITEGYHCIDLFDFTMTLDADKNIWVPSIIVSDCSYQKIGVKSLDMSISRIDGKH